jgi:argininosuccinate lyase
MKATITWNKESIIKLIETNNLAVERAILVVWKNQTKEEQRASDTLENNGVGFTGAHAKMGSYYAEWINSGKHLNGKHLEKARKMAVKYHRQLLAAVVTH